MTDAEQGNGTTSLGTIEGDVKGSVYLAADQFDWQPTKEGKVSEKYLYRNTQAGVRTLLSRLSPGASSPAHTHPGEIEQVYVLEGEFFDGNRTLRAGDYCCRSSDAVHTGTTQTGAVLLLTYTRA